MLAAVLNGIEKNIDDDGSDLRLDYAKFLLVQTKEPLPKIAETCGWSSEQKFCDYFHAAVGVSPLHYRDWHQS
jgi:transcriptional regulator GlxA family with amidase domain